MHLNVIFLKIKKMMSMCNMNKGYEHLKVAIINENIFRLDFGNDMY